MDGAFVPFDVNDWRLQQLLEAGYPLRFAEQLANRPWWEVDLHEAIRLVRAGCPPATAVEILL